MASLECCKNPPILSPSSGVGVIEEIAGLKCYVSGSSDSKLAVLLASDVFGYEAPNLRKLADKIAAAGFYAVVPDFFYGDPMEADLRNAINWLKVHGPEKGFEDAKPLVAALRSKAISAIGAAGFCWGAKVVVELAKSDDIQAAVLLHPTFVTLDDIKELIKPTAILGAEADHLFPPELMKQVEDTLSLRPEVNSFVKIFPGVSHGWSIRYDIEDKKAAKSAEESHQDILDWFTKYLKSAENSRQIDTEV